VAEQRLTTLSDYLGALKRRFWLLILAVVVATGSAFVFSSRQTPAYQATAQVQYAATPLSQILNPTGHVSSQVNQQNLATAAQTAHTTAVAKLALASAKVNALTPDLLLKESSVSPSTTSNFLTFTVTDRYPARAEALATAYATAYATYSNSANVRSVNAQIVKYQAQKNKLVKQYNHDVAAAGGHQSGGAADLEALHAVEGTLGLLTAAQASYAHGNVVVQTAQSATKVRPATTRNLAMGFGLGVVIGLVLVSLAEALDTRMRSADDVAGRLGLPLLTRIPIPPRTLRKAGGLSMLDDETGAQTEAYRKLRISLDFANLTRKARTIMVTSAMEQEGKSTTVANLAVALARAGRRVVLVDLDLRKPYLDRFFDLEGKAGITDVALGNVTLDQAMWSIPVPGSDGGPQAGSLHVLPSGPVPPNPADLIESSIISEVLLDLVPRADVVLLDAAPLLPVSDGVVLSNKVDGMLVVVRASTIKRPMVDELRRILEVCPAAKLGFVLTGVEEGEGYGYSGYGGYAAASPQQPRVEPQLDDHVGASPGDEAVSGRPRNLDPR
jgi:capsular exopolysaccharide synthesis family protein